MADALDLGKEILHGREPNPALPESASGQNFRLQPALLAEKQDLSHSDLSPGTHQALPRIRLARELTSQENFDPAA